MHTSQIFALLVDSLASVLLIRRRGSILWGLPGGDVKPSIPMDELLATYCHRQVGASPDFAGTFSEFTLAGRRVALGFGEVPHARAGARGRVEAVLWMRPDNVPNDMDPIARMAIAVRKGQTGVIRPGAFVGTPIVNAAP
jgi:hypothetical protein